MNKQFEELFQKANNIIINGVEPKELNITIKEPDLADLKRSPIISTVGYLLINLTGANGPLSLNNITNIITNNTGILRLHDFYNKSIHFIFNITSHNNDSLCNCDIGLEDLNISGLNTSNIITALEPYNQILLNSYIDLLDLKVNLTFSLKITLYNTSHSVEEESILYEIINVRTNLVNNTLKNLFQLPVNNKIAKEYTNNECLNLECIADLADSNGTGIAALSLNETFSYIRLLVVQHGGLEEDVVDTIEKLLDLFKMSYADKTSLLINAFLNTTIINFVNIQINKYLYSSSCPGLDDKEEGGINILITSLAVVLSLTFFTLLIFYPYILGKACRKKDNDTIKLLLKEEGNEKANEEANNHEIKNDKDNDMQSKYCIKNMSLGWIKEFCRTDPIGASLFLHPKIHLFWRLFIPLSIFGTIVLFIISQSCRCHLFFCFTCRKENQNDFLYFGFSSFFYGHVECRSISFIDIHSSF